MLDVKPQERFGGIFGMGRARRTAFARPSCASRVLRCRAVESAGSVFVGFRFSRELQASKHGEGLVSPSVVKIGENF